MFVSFVEGFIKRQWPSKENFLAYKNEKNKLIFESNTKKGSKSFWNTIKPFLINRGIIANDSITLEENEVLKNDPQKNKLKS